MTELRELYQQVILDHNKHPQNFGALPGATFSQEGYNPLCGDKFHVHVLLTGGFVQDIKFEGSGCAISKASASLMTSNLKGRNVAEIEQVFGKFQAMVTAQPEAEVDVAALGKLAVFAGVREFPMRVKCATLAWHTVKAAIDGQHAAVTTE